jgi:predicted aconitase with swiveling domain
MREFHGRGIVSGQARAPALVTAQALNLTAAFSKPPNLIRRWNGVIQDRLHELYKQDVAGKVLIFPQCIGSTYTGMILLEVIARGRGPAAMVVQNADSLLVSGALLAEVWLARKVPLVEVGAADIFSAIRTGDLVEVDGETGIVRVL